MHERVEEVFGFSQICSNTSELVKTVMSEVIHLGVTIITRKEGQLTYDEVMSPTFQKVEWQVEMVIRQITKRLMNIGGNSDELDKY